jgi:hypothetical protein
MSPRPDWDEQRPDPLPSIVVVDPVAQLACGIFLQAVRDLQLKNMPARSIDALIFLLDDGYFYGDALNIYIPPGEILCLASRYREVYNGGKI